ncbi:MAG: D-alanyl-D-alanine carboxypeptidase, partial [Clostridia bacterium]|nr:D-alanyl-D-alanine carboxypeptidase [Clostridia bacterium]
MKRFFSFLICLSLLILSTALPCSAAEVGPLSAECAVLYDPAGDRVLYGKNADKRHAMASTTKIMTALVALRHLPLDTVVTVPKEATGVEGSSVYLKPGETYTLEALLYALLLQSANDAAEVIAYAVAGGVEPFADLMNDVAEELGLSNTHFENPHGLDGEAHYTTAKELAMIAA